MKKLLFAIECIAIFIFVLGICFYDSNWTLGMLLIVGAGVILGICIRQEKKYT